MQSMIKLKEEIINQAINYVEENLPPAIDRLDVRK